MKAIKMLGLAALAALMAMAFVGASSAMAESTALCKEDAVAKSEEKCPTGKLITHVHEVSVGKGLLLSSAVTVECEVLFLGDVTSENNLGAPLQIEGNLTYPMAGCETSTGALCEVTELSAHANIEVLKTGHELAEVKGSAEVNVHCGAFINCTYNGVNLLGHGLGPLLSTSLNGNVGISEQTTNKIGGAFCPKTAKLDLTTSPLEHTYISRGGGLTATSTSISTSLKGGGKEGAEITVAEGSKVKDTATLSGTNASSATGTVDYAVYKDKECKELATEAGEVTVKEGKIPDSEEKELEAGAVYYWQAKYLGDSMNEASTSTCSKEVLTVKAKVTLSTTLSGDGKEGAEITVAESSKVKDTATLSGTKASSATGTVDYAVYKDKECKELATEAGKGKVEGTKAASSEEKELAAGVYYWQAKYLGDSLHEESTSTCSKEVLTVMKFEPYKTALCTTDDAGLFCLEEHKPTTVDFKDSAAEFLTSLISTKCEGLISGSVGAAGKPQKVTGEYKFNSCTNGCLVTEISGGSQLGFLFETSEKSTEELATATTEGLELFYKCGETVKCAYGPIKAVGDSLGALKTGDNGHITFSKDSLGEGEGLFCPEEASLDALFVASSAFYIRKDYGLTSLCSKDEGSPVCKSENQLKTIDYKDKAVELLTNLINVKCEGLVSGSVGEPGNPLEIKPELTYTGCSGGCFVTSVAGPGKIMLQREGVAEEAKATSEGFEIFVKCGTTIKCLLGPEKMVGKALGALTTGDNGHLTFSKVSMGKGEGATCPSEATLDALFVASSAAYIG